MLLKDKKAIITGASKGIGKKIAETFALNGADLIITARSESIKDLAKELSTSSVSVFPVIGDINDENHIKEIIKTCKDNFGTLDILVNNAGILKASILGMTTTDSIRESFNTNIISAIILTQYAIRLMNKAGSKSIINISSILGIKGKEGVSIYSATKSAIIGFTLSAAKELGNKNIRINSIAPGFIDTNMIKDLPKEQYEKYANNIKLGRIGTAQDVANCALFLASDLSSYITGQIIGVDGGLIV